MSTLPKAVQDGAIDLRVKTTVNQHAYFVAKITNPNTGVTQEGTIANENLYGHINLPLKYFYEAVNIDFNPGNPKKTIGFA